MRVKLATSIIAWFCHQPNVSAIPVPLGASFLRCSQHALRAAALRDKFARSSSPDEQKKIAADIQKEAYEQVIYIPLGQYLLASGWRKSLSGVLDGPATPIFWNIDKSE
jgi:hypothetical protein